MAYFVPVLTVHPSCVSLCWKITVIPVLGITVCSSCSVKRVSPPSKSALRYTRTLWRVTWESLGQYQRPMWGANRWPDSDTSSDVRSSPLEQSYPCARECGDEASETNLRTFPGRPWWRDPGRGTSDYLSRSPVQMLQSEKSGDRTPGNYKRFLRPTGNIRTRIETVRQYEYWWLLDM